MFHASPSLTGLHIDFAHGSPAVSGDKRDLAGTPLQQSGSYAAVLASFGCESALARIRADGRLIGQARIHLRRFGPLRFAWMPRGPVWTNTAAREDMITAIAALPRRAPFRALWASSVDAPRRGIKVSRSAQMTEWDLGSCDTDRRAALHGKWRNRLKRAEGAGLSVTQRPLDIMRDAALLERETAQRQSRGYAAMPLRFTHGWARIAPKDSLMLTANENGEAVAFVLMLLHGDVATYHLGWSGARGRALQAHTLLLWQASCALSERGIRRLDLGTACETNAPGLTRFKLGTGAALVPLSATCLHL